MKSLGETLKKAREQRGLTLRNVSEKVYVDQSLISRFEKDERKPTKEQLIRLAKFYNLSEKKLKIDWYSEKIAQELKHIESTSEILKVAEEKIKYYKNQKNGK